jgi:3-dehydroquinate synthase
MVDACVGGKTGVNFPPYGKNQLGAFAFPHKVTIDPAWLTTLESRDILAGGAECLKHAILAGKPDLMTGLTTALQQQNLTTLAAYLPTMVQIKADIVAKDPTEQGIRATLNLGHTLAHALEAVSHGSGNPPDQTIHHGEAVALGLYFATILSERAGYLAKDKSSFITQHLLQSGTIIGKAQLARYLGSQTLSQDDIWPRIAAHFAHDKKHKSNQTASQWILLQDFGTVQRDEDGSYTVGVDAEILKLSWDQFLSEIF